MRLVRSLLIAAVILPAGCRGRATPAPSRALTLATTTSTQDSGLLDALLPLFRDRSGIDVKVIAVGSGQALQLGRRGDADVILAHSPEAEEQFMADGFGESRRAVMHNDFVLVGPPADPAGVRGGASIAKALATIAAARAPFLSRGDDSGTHQKERQVWAAAGVAPVGDWYVEAGSGMAAVLRLADQRRGYTLSDRATFLAQKGQLDLAVLVEGDPLLANRYHVLVVRPAKHPGVWADGARRFADFLASPEARAAIARFGIDRFGEPLFFPDAVEDPARP